MQRGEAQRLGNLPGSPVADRRVEYLALAHQVVQRSQYFFHRQAGIEQVREVELQAVRSQPAQAALDLQHDMPACHAAGVGACPDRRPKLAGDDDFVADAGDQPAQDLFRLPSVVDVRRVEEVDADVAAALEHVLRRRLVGVAAK